MQFLRRHFSFTPSAMMTRKTLHSRKTKWICFSSDNGTPNGYLGVVLMMLYSDCCGTHAAFDSFFYSVGLSVHWSRPLRLHEPSETRLSHRKWWQLYDRVQAKSDIWVSGYFTLICMELAPLSCSLGHDQVTYVSPLTCTTRKAPKAPTILGITVKNRG